MREDIHKLEQGKDVLRCNCCGKPIEKMDKLNQHVDHLHIEKTWNYFSNKDLTKHYFNLCEVCYDKWIETFVIPAQEVCVTEVFRCIDDVREVQCKEIEKK